MHKIKFFNKYIYKTRKENDDELLSIHLSENFW